MAGRLAMLPPGLAAGLSLFGERKRQPLLLVMGLGSQMVVWEDPFCEQLAGRGFWVIRFDNRDVGLSTHLHDAPPPNLGAAMGGDFSSASYRLEDMADNVSRRAIADLFENEKDPIQLIKLKELYEVLESATDKAEDAANVLEAIVVKST